VPDIYQGQELWDFSLVDPDNRRPVDFCQRRELLAQLRESASQGAAPQLELARHLARTPRDPRAKLLVTWKSLDFRREHRTLFSEGEYRPLATSGEFAAHVCAFAWRRAMAGASPQWAIVLAPRWLAKLSDAGSVTPFVPTGAGVWRDTRVLLSESLPGRLRNVFTYQDVSLAGDGLSAADAFADFPVALLVTN